MEIGADHEFAQGDDALAVVFDREEILAELGEGGEVRGGERGVSKSLRVVIFPAWPSTTGTWWEASLESGAGVSVWVSSVAEMERGRIRPRRSGRRV